MTLPRKDDVEAMEADEDFINFVIVVGIAVAAAVLLFLSL